MSHHFIVPTNENGMSLDQYIATDLTSSMRAPFQFNHVFLYSHGWWTNSIRAMEGYNRFTIEFSRFFRSVPALTELPTLSVGIHWPSTLTEDEVSVENYFQALSFYTMEKRADGIGQNAAYTLLRIILDARQGQQAPLTIHLLGHSFGAKVVCAALERLVEQQAANPIPANVTFDLALLEAAFDYDELEPQNEYGSLGGSLPGLRLLVTHSDQDTALSGLYPAAHRMARLLGKSKPALGFAGPSQGVTDLFGGATAIDVGPAFAAKPADLPGRLLVANLTPLHAAHPDNAVRFSGHHSDIFYSEIYALLSAFYGLA
jgi:hypothetical protein